MGRLNAVRLTERAIARELRTAEAHRVSQMARLDKLKTDNEATRGRIDALRLDSCTFRKINGRMQVSATLLVFLL